MTLFDHMRVSIRSGLSAIDQDGDRAESFIARYGGSPALDGWLRELRVERLTQLVMLQGLEELRQQNHPALGCEVRSTRMLKVSLRQAVRGAAAGGER